jgi:hypothetical protein
MHCQDTLERRRSHESYRLAPEWLAWAQGRARLDDPNPPGPSDTQLPRLQIGNGADPVSNAQAMLGACQVIIDLETYTK